MQFSRPIKGGWDSVVVTVTRLQAGPSGASDFFILPNVLISCRSHPAPSSVGTGCSIPSGMVAGAWSWPFRAEGNV
jgi:hypothetical protein